MDPRVPLTRSTGSGSGPEVLADPAPHVRLLHRDRFVDVDRAADLEDRAALRELDRRIEAVGRHDRVAGQAARATTADRAARADRLRGPGRGAAVDDGRTELSEPLTPLGVLRVALGLVGGHTLAA